MDSAFINIYHVQFSKLQCVFMSTICFRYIFDDKEDSGNDEASVKTVTSEDDNDMTWILYCTVLYYNVLYCTALYCTVLYCTDLEPMEASTPCLLTVSMLSSGWMSVTLRLLQPATCQPIRVSAEIT